MRFFKITVLGVFGIGCLAMAAAVGTASTRAEMITLLEQWQSDNGNWQRRQTGMSSETLHDAQFWYDKYPTHYSYERIRELGRAADSLLSDISKDAHCDKKLRDSATMFLNTSDEERQLEYILSLYDKHQIPDGSLLYQLKSCVPLGDVEARLDEPRLARWVRDNLKSKGFNGLLFELLDEIMKEPEANHPDQLQPGDERVVRWLNYFNDQSIDQMLQEKAPEAFHLREREIARGCDPLVSFVEFEDAVHYHQLSKAASSVYQSPKDAKACVALFEVVYGYLGELPYLTPDPPEWRKHLRKWYWAHRQQMSYSRSKMCVVVKGNKAGK